MKKSFSLLIALFFVVSCGGGGGGDSTAPPTPVGTAVDLRIVKGFYSGTAAPGSQASFNISGSDSTGQAWTGSLSMVSDGPTTFEGNNVNKRRFLTTLTRTVDGSSASSITTEYYLASNNNFYKSVSSSGVTEVPITQTQLPDNARVGDFGNLRTLRGSNNITHSGTWKLEGDYNGNSKITFSHMNQDSSNVITSLEDDTFYLDTTGNPYKYTVTLITNSIHLTMSGNRNP
jgi:hypothetical protein